MAIPQQPPPPGPPSRPGLTDAQRWTIGGVLAVVALLVVAVVVLAGRGDDDAASTSTTTGPTTTTTASTTTTTAAEDTTTTSFAPSVDPFAVAYPSPEGSQRFEQPPAAARSYATEVLGFTELVLGAAQAGADGGTEVVVQPDEDGPETRIQLIEADGAWFAVGSTTDAITVSQPAPGTSLASPFQTAGEALAFEGSVQVLVLSQTDPMPLGEGVVTGSGTPPPGPFSGDISFTAPAGATPGILVYRIGSPEDGRVVQATSFRVRVTDLTT